MSRPRPLRQVAAALAGAAVLAVWALTLHALGDPARDAEATARDRAVDAAAPDGVVLGNSITRTDVDPDQLARALPGAPSVVALDLDGAGAPAWEALLTRHVIARGHRPAWVLVVSDPAYAVVMADEAPRGSTDDGDASALARIQRGARLARREALGVVRAAVAHALSAATGASLPVAAGRVEAAAQSWLHDPSRLDPAALPPRPAHAEPDPAPLRSLAAGCARARSRLIVVAPPLRSGGDPRATEAARAALEGLRGVTWLDLSSTPLPEGAWLDDVHLAPAGRAAFTASLADALSDHLP